LFNSDWQVVEGMEAIRRPGLLGDVTLVAESLKVLVRCQICFKSDWTE
jgi:hypothetical protein